MPNFSRHGSQKGLKQLRRPSRSLKVTGNGAKRQSAYDFLELSITMSLSCTVSEILSLMFQDLKRLLPLRAYSLVSFSTRNVQYRSFTNFKDMIRGQKF